MGTAVDLMAAWNDTEHDLPAATIPELVDAQVARTPERTAVVYEDTELSYAEMDARARRLARRLIELGVGTGDIVALAIPRSVELIIGLLAVLKAGAAYLPVDPDYPADRIAYMLGDAAPVLLLTTPAAAASLPADVPRLVLEAGASGGERDGPTSAIAARAGR